MELPVLPPVDDRAAIEAWVAAHLGDLALEGPGGVRGSERFRGGQVAADGALAQWDPAGYAARRNEVWPEDRRGASGLSPYIRHGLLPLRRVWDHVADGPARDRSKLRDELLWQEYARHLYARLGPATARDLRHHAPAADPAVWPEPYRRDMACMALVRAELERDGWLVNQTRMWVASQWSVRAGRAWQEGEAELYQHLLDGSRAANRLGWQWTAGTGTGRPYGFSRSQVRKRAPGLCTTCGLRDACPIEGWPEPVAQARVADPDLRLREDPDPGATAGPSAVTGDGRTVDAVWLTAESLGDDDPALAAHPDRPAVFVFDERFQARVRLSGKRLVFLAETLAERRPLTVLRGDPAALLSGRALAATHAPVPGWRRIARSLPPAEVHPWPWLAPPHGGPIGSYSAWIRRAKVRP